MQFHRAASLAACLTLLQAAPARGQAPPLRIEAPGARVELSLTDLAAMVHDTVRIRFRDTTSHLYAGIPAHLLLARVGVHADSMRGRTPMARRVVVEAADGYRVVLSLAELDPALGDRRVVLADRVDGAALAASEGPLRLIIGGDTRHARWIRNVTRIRVLDESP
jgi:hypothetical protein